MLVIGICVFMYSDGKSKSKEEKNSILIGYAILGVSLLMDGILGAAEDLLRKVAKPSSIHFMYYLNAWSVPILLIAFIISGEIVPFINFCVKFPIVNLWIGAFVAVGCLGQFLMANLISKFGALPLTLTMTMRKFFTVLFSVFFFKNSFGAIQWLATILIFTALILNTFYGKKKENVKNDVEESSKSVAFNESCNKNDEKY